MKTTLSILALTLTISMANIDTSSLSKTPKQIGTLTKAEVNTRVVRESRKVRETRSITTIKTSSFRLARASRQIRTNRFIAQVPRESRKTRHILTQNEVHFASLK
jgi:hypothetical protein